MREVRDYMKKNNQDMTDISQIVSAQWRSMSEEEKAPYGTMADDHNLRIGLAQSAESRFSGPSQASSSGAAASGASGEAMSSSRSASAAPVQSQGASAISERSRSAQSSRGESSAAAALPPRSRTSASSAASVDAENGVRTRPTTNHGWSITVNHPQGYGIEQMLPKFKRWLQQQKGKGGASVEICPRANHLHLQCAVALPGGKKGMQVVALRKSFKDAVGIKRGAGYKVILKDFSGAKSTSQTMPLMMGYIQKDEGQKHYKLVTHG